MRIVLQRVSRATVTMDGIPPRSVARGYVLLFGVTHGDTTADADRLAARIPVLRLFPDATGRMERNLIEVDGEVMVISQFTLFGSLKKGTKPSFSDAAQPGLARALYEYFVEALQKLMPHPVVTGEFAAHMDVELVNDGPVTLLLDTTGKNFGD